MRLNRWCVRSQPIDDQRVSVSREEEEGGEALRFRLLKRKISAPIHKYTRQALSLLSLTGKSMDKLFHPGCRVRGATHSFLFTTVLDCILVNFSWYFCEFIPTTCQWRRRVAPTDSFQRIHSNGFIPRACHRATTCM